MHMTGSDQGSIETIKLSREHFPSTASDSLLPILLNAKSICSHSLSSDVPRNIKTNSTFMIDLDKLEDPKDVLCDDMGRWDQSRTSKKHYNMSILKSGHFGAATPTTKSEQTFEIVRRPYTNASDKSLKKTVINIIRPEGNLHSVVFVIYLFSGIEHKVVAKKHGNSQINIPYIGT